MLPGPGRLFDAMQIAFVDYTPWNYTPASAYQVPLGGSQSAICYLSEQLALLGQDVRLFNGTAQVSVSRGVTVAPLTKVSAATWKELDVVVVQNWAKLGHELKPRLRPDARLILWTQHAHDQPAMRALSDPTFRNAHDAFVFVSDWQRREYLNAFAIDANRAFVMRNALGPAFERLFSAEETILTAKSSPPVLAYTSTPFRGLELLLDVFPRIRAALPGVTLRVYSSMQVYQLSPERDAQRYGELYNRCRNTPGVQYVGSLPQPELATELRQVPVLAYPNTFPETSCIAVMEALASGCRVVTSDLGALPETTAGFADLISCGTDTDAYRKQFANATIDAVRQTIDDPQTAEATLRHQVQWMNNQCAWRHRALEWQHWLLQL
jgi:glycosyltransferase involved in cell wall biosynthesis